MLGGYLVAGDGDEASGSNVHAVQSYKDAPADELEYTMDINGEAVMRPVIKQYETLEPVKADFLDALLNWKRGKGVAILMLAKWLMIIHLLKMKSIMKKLLLSHKKLVN